MCYGTFHTVEPFISTPVSIYICIHCSLDADFEDFFTSYESRLVYFVISSVIGGKEAALKHMIPYINQYMIDRQSMNEKPVILSPCMAVHPC